MLSRSLTVHALVLAGLSLAPAAFAQSGQPADPGTAAGSPTDPRSAEGPANLPREQPVDSGFQASSPDDPGSTPIPAVPETSADGVDPSDSSEGGESGAPPSAAPEPGSLVLLGLGGLGLAAWARGRTRRKGRA